MSVDPKFTFWFGVWTNVLALLAGYSLQHAPAAIAAYASDAQWYAGVIVQSNSLILTALAGVSSPKAGPLAGVPASAAKPVIILFIMLAALALSSSAHAQGRRPAVTGNPIADIKTDLAQQKAAAISEPSDSAAALPCTFKMLTKLTPANLLPTITQCIATKLVADTQRALTSAQAYGTTGKGDADAINCLTPALAIFQAGVEVPAVPEVPAVLNPDGSIKTPAVAAVPAQDPGPILLYQKYREFTLSGALTSCQSWFNGPINATAAAGLGAASTAIGGAALLAPLK